MTIHAYKKNVWVRAITLGMAKFGLPDIVVDQFLWGLSRNVGHLINLFSQSLAEGAPVDPSGQFTLDLKKIRSAEVRDPQLDSLKAHATGAAMLTLRSGKRDEGDPKNRLIEIGFDRYPGLDEQARQEKLLSELFGWTDGVVNVGQYNKTLNEASDRARKRVPKLRADFETGLAPGETILLKAPFFAPDGRSEYMWVEVASWSGANIKGMLKSEPFLIPGLHAGQMVEIKEEKIFDYLRAFPNGSSEGNETGKIIEALRLPETQQ